MDARPSHPLVYAGVLFLICILPSRIQASNNAIFYESFDEDFQGRWTVSSNKDYKGVWKHSKSNGHEDFGLLVSEKAQKYAIVKVLDHEVSLKDGTVVLQYEVRLQNGLECGGAYIKYLRPQDAGWKAKEFDNESPYSIMFGPDKCGLTNKVHFIIKHKNPKTGSYVEHHLKYPPTVLSDKLSHVYTVIMTPHNELMVLIDGEEKSKVNFLSSDDFEPPLIPEKTITDPDDRKPEDWDDRRKIPDPDVVKPDDWDEDIPAVIEDEDAVKPEGWLDDEPEEINDPNATKPEDWDDEEDGIWEPPQIPNMKCQMAPGCGEWTKPVKNNPAYKGIWKAPMIDNPNYQGVWKPRVIPNPDYFKLDRPDFEPIAAIGIEIWTMQEGILFDNILIASDEKTAESYRETAWKPKFDKETLESAGSGILSSFQEKVFEYLHKVPDIPYLERHKPQILELIEKAEMQPMITIGVIVAVIAVIFTNIAICFTSLFAGKKPEAKAKANVPNMKTEATFKASDDRNEHSSIEEDEAPVTTRRRSTRRET